MRESEAEAKYDENDVVEGGGDWKRSSWHWREREKQGFAESWCFCQREVEKEK